MTAAAAAVAVLEPVDREGLRPIDEEPAARPARAHDRTERVRLICDETVHR